MSKFKDCVHEIVENIRNDRDSASELLNDAKNYIQQNVENHKTVGNTMAKYIEALQRSNDQLIKLLTLQERRERQEDDSLSPDDLYDLIDKKEEEG